VVVKILDRLFDSQVIFRELLVITDGCVHKILLLVYIHFMNIADFARPDSCYLASE
jgi:hypothetical protein